MRKLPGGGAEFEPNDSRQELVCIAPDGETTSQRFRQASTGTSWGGATGTRRSSDSTAVMPRPFICSRPGGTDTRPCRTPITKRLYYEIDGGRRSIAPENVLHVAGLGWDGLVKFGPIAFMSRAVGLEMAS